MASIQHALCSRRANPYRAIWRGFAWRISIWTLTRSVRTRRSTTRSMLGFPAVSLAGRSMAARASAAQLRAAGLGELVATSSDEYHEIALSLAHDRVRLRSLTQRLRTEGRASALFDMRSYTVHFENAMLQIWDEWRATTTPG